MKKFSSLLLVSLASGLLATANADTTKVKTHTTVEVFKQGDHCEDDPNCFNRYHPAIKPIARANPGDLIVVHTRDALDSNLTIDSLPKDVLAIDLNLIHPMTGLSTSKVLSVVMYSL
jgi:formamidase